VHVIVFGESGTFTNFRFKAHFMVIHSSVPDFVLFLYVHLAQIDESYDPRELAVIKSRMKALFPEGTDLERKLYQAIRDYQKLDKSSIGKICADTIAFFNHSGSPFSAKLIRELEEIVKADGNLQQSEQQALDRLTEILSGQPKV
jgi:uncharacterized tellurite resistance protein B-like protein